MTRTDKTSNTRAEPAGAKSTGRVFEFLEYLAESPTGATFSQIADDLGLPKSSLHSLLVISADRGWIYLHEATRKYRIGVRAWQVGLSFSPLDSLAQIALPFMTVVRDQLRETVQLAVLDGVDNIYVAKVEAEHELRLVSTVGARLPAYATGIGKALLASLDDEEFRRRMAGVELRQFTERTISTMAALEAAIVEIRANGYAEDDGEYTPGIHCVAVPVFGEAGKVVAAMSCSLPNARLHGTDNSRAALLGSLRDQSRELSEQLVAAGF